MATKMTPYRDGRSAAHARFEERRKQLNSRGTDGRLKRAGSRKEQRAWQREVATLAPKSLEELDQAERELDRYERGLNELVNLERQLEAEKQRRRPGRRRVALALACALAAVPWLPLDSHAEEAPEDMADVLVEQQIDAPLPDATDPDCAPTMNCLWNARCTKQGGACVVSSEQHCVTSYNCERKGLCSLSEGRCVAADGGDCANSLACRDGGMCTAVDGSCQRP